MKTTDSLLASLFLGVIVLLVIGSVGEQIASLFQKVKNLFTSKITASEDVLEVSKQLR